MRKPLLFVALVLFVVLFAVPAMAGTHVITATAYDAAGNSSTATVTVTTVDVTSRKPDLPNWVALAVVAPLVILGGGIIAARYILSHHG